MDVEGKTSCDVNSIAPRARSWEIAWVIARMVAGCALLAFFVLAMTYRFHNASFPFALHGDQHQSIGHYWRYAVDGAIPPGHLLSDYAFVYHTSPLWWIVMAGSSSIIGPLTSAKVLGVLAYLLYAVGLAAVVGRRTDWLLGLLIALVAIRAPPDPVEQITGGMARSMGPALVYLFLLAFMERRHKLALVTLVLQAGIYPSVVIPCGLTYGAWCVIKGPMPERIRRCAGMFIAGLLIILLGKAQDLRAPDWWGSAVTYEEAEQMPAWRAGGRFQEVPHSPLPWLLRANLVRPFKELGERPIPEGTARWTEGHLEVVFVYGPIGLGLLLLAVGTILRRRRAPAPADELSKPFPWEILLLFAGTLAAYAVVRGFAFRLFLPSRQIGFVVQFLVLAGVPLIVWAGFASLLPRQRAALVLCTALVCVVPAFAFRGTGLGVTAAGYGANASDGRLWEAVRKLPLDEEIACDVAFCEKAMPLGQHAPYAARNLAHPLRKGYYNEVERRLVETYRVIYATSGQEVADFVEKEKVRYLVYHASTAGKFEPRSFFLPLTDKVRRVFRAGRSRSRLLLDPPEDAVVYREKDRVILDLTKIPRDAVGTAPIEPPPAAKPAGGRAKLPGKLPLPQQTSLSSSGETTSQNASAPPSVPAAADLQRGR